MELEKRDLDVRCEDEISRLRDTVRQLKEREADDVAAFKMSTQRSLEAKNAEIHDLQNRIDELSLENGELRIQLKRALENESECKKECERRSHVISCQRSTMAKFGKQAQENRVSQSHSFMQDAMFMRALRARVGELQKVSDSIEASLDSKNWLLVADNPYEDEAVGGICPECTTAGCQPDPVGIGHSVKVVIITRNAEGMPCRGASVRDFEIATVGTITDVSAVHGSRSCFALSFIPREVGRCGIIVTYRGHSVTCTTSSVATSEPFDSKQTAIMLSPNPVQSGVQVTGTVITKNAQGLVIPSPHPSEFSAVALGNATMLSPLRQCEECPSQLTFTFVPNEVGRSGVALSYGDVSKTAAVEVVDVLTPAISTMHTVLSCSPNPAKIDEEVTVFLTTRSASGVPTAGASIEDLRNLRPVGGASHLQPFEAVSPSTFKTTFIARKAGASGIAVSFMGLTLYATTMAVTGPESIDLSKTSMSCSQRDVSVDFPVDILITSRDKWGAPFPCKNEAAWSLSAEEPSLEIISMEKIGCCTMKGQLRPKVPGRHTVELLNCNDEVTKLTLDVLPKQLWDVRHTRLLVRKDVGYDVTQQSSAVAQGEPLEVVSELETALLVITTFSQAGLPAIGPPASAISITGAVASPVIKVSEGVYQSHISCFRPGLLELRVDMDGEAISTSLPVVASGGPADPRRTVVECRPDTVLQGDTVSALISFYDIEGNPAPAPDTSQLALEPIGGITTLTRVAPAMDTRLGMSTLEVVFVCEEAGQSGLVVRHDNHSVESYTTVCTTDSLDSGPCCLSTTDISLSPNPVRPGHQVQCLITIRDYRSAPLHSVIMEPISIVLRPLVNTARVSTKVQAVPGASNTWIASFTAGDDPGETGVAVEVNGYVVVATTTVEEELFDGLDDELQRLRELTNRLYDDTERDLNATNASSLQNASMDTTARVAQEQLLEIEENRQRHIAQNQQRREARTMFPHFGLEVTDSIKFHGKYGARFEYAGVKVVAVKGAAQKAGIVPDDTITMIEGSSVVFLSDIKDLLRDSKPGVPVQLCVRSKYDSIERGISIVPDKSPVPTDQRMGYTRRVKVNPVEMGLPAETPSLPRVASMADDSPSRGTRSPSLGTESKRTNSPRPRIRYE